MTLRLYDFAASPFCIKVRSILDYKKQDYDRIDASKPSVMAELRRRGGIGKVPALDIDGELICDSTDIAYALEARVAEPSILPSEAGKRGLCHVIEDWADESLYWHGVYCRWVDPAGRDGAPAIFPKGFLGQRVIPRVVARTAARQLKGQGTGRKSPAHISRDLDRQLDHLRLLLTSGGFLLGPTPVLCDFAVNAQLVYLGRTPRGREGLDTRPEIGAFMERMKGLRERAS